MNKIRIWEFEVDAPPGVDERGEDLFVSLLCCLNQDPQRSEGGEHRKQVPQADHGWNHKYKI